MTYPARVPAPVPTVVAIAASHPAVRAGLEALVGSNADLELVATVADARGAARCLLQHHPDVLLVALPEAPRNGGALIRHLRTMAPDTAVVIASTASTNAYRSIARSAGAAALVALDGDSETLLDAVRASGRAEAQAGDVRERAAPRGSTTSGAST
jgi:DNA-binding NarL/FixJ family response regulator